jgi:hypothetical protein
MRSKMRKFVVHDIIHLETGNLYYEVIEDDGQKYPQMGLYCLKKDAEQAKSDKGK